MVMLYLSINSAPFLVASVSVALPGLNNPHDHMVNNNIIPYIPLHPEVLDALPSDFGPFSDPDAREAMATRHFDVEEGPKAFELPFDRGKVMRRRRETFPNQHHLVAGSDPIITPSGPSSSKTDGLLTNANVHGRPQTVSGGRLEATAGRSNPGPDSHGRPGVTNDKFSVDLPESLLTDATAMADEETEQGQKEPIASEVILPSPWMVRKSLSVRYLIGWVSPVGLVRVFC